MIESIESIDLVERAERILESITYEGYQFATILTKRGEVYVQGVYDEADVYSGHRALQYTRRWLLSTAMTDSEIVQTIFKLCLTSAEHRCREHFQYKGARIFGPHFDVEDLVALCNDGRENAGGRK